MNAQNTTELFYHQRLSAFCLKSSNSNVLPGLSTSDLLLLIRKSSFMLFLLSPCFYKGFALYLSKFCVCAGNIAPRPVSAPFPQSPRPRIPSPAVALPLPRRGAPSASPTSPPRSSPPTTVCPRLPRATCSAVSFVDSVMSPSRR